MKHEEKGLDELGPWLRNIKVRLLLRNWESQEEEALADYMEVVFNKLFAACDNF